MNLFLFLLQVVVISLSGVLAPGPVMTAAIAAGTKSKHAANLGYLAIILFALVHSLCDMGWLEILSFASFKGMKLLNEKNQKNVLAICAAAIMFFGIVFITKSFLSL